MEENILLLNQLFEEAGLPLTEAQSRAFLTVYERLVTENELMNLTAITEFRDVVIKHFLDSVLPLTVFPLTDAQSSALPQAAHSCPVSLIDVGSGAGFPGLPLKLLQPTLKLTMLDSLNKRVGYLNRLIGELALTDAEAVHGRAEEYARTRREAFDFAAARAVAHLAVLSEYCLPFVKTGGCFLAYKGGDVADELREAGRAIRLLGGETEQVLHFTLPENAGERSLVVIRKTAPSPKKYPRRAGLPAKEPIL